uniref:Uncharacterized protein n=1 Tax=Rhizophora mucronata TaxID=61149 RepID=A0A2P2LJQ0_RHIMU
MTSNKILFKFSYFSKDLKEWFKKGRDLKEV